VKQKKKVLIILIIIGILLYVFNIKEKSTLIFLSDYQDINNFNINKDKNLKNILMKIKEDKKNIELVSFLGDYQNWPLEEGLSNKGIEEANQITQTIFPNVNTIFISGNHDYKDFEKDSSYYTSSGLYEYKSYYIYLINYSDYFNYDYITIDLAYSLRILDKNKPIIVLSHMPLHHSERNDNIYGCYIFDILNEYSKKYDIIYLFGHNHSLGYDNDIGGSIVYKTIGDDIKIKYSDGNIQNKKLNFTYMNAGYVGYYNDSIEKLNIDSSTNYNTEETISVFKIYNNKILINRYTENGILKKHEIKLKN